MCYNSRRNILVISWWNVNVLTTPTTHTTSRLLNSSFVYSVMCLLIIICLAISQVEKSWCQGYLLEWPPCLLLLLHLRNAERMQVTELFFTEGHLCWQEWVNGCTNYFPPALTVCTFIWMDAVALSDYHFNQLTFPNIIIINLKIHACMRPSVHYHLW